MNHSAYHPYKAQQTLTPLLPLLIALWYSILLCSCRYTPKDITSIPQNKDRYVGELSNGKREGLGTLYENGKILYAGQWHDNKRNGQGYTYDAEGHKISGIWEEDSLIIGERQLKGTVYKGEFNRLLQAHGHGKTTDVDGRFYEGEWENGLKHGFGYSTTHRHLRVGEWKEDRFKGERPTYTTAHVYGIDISKHQHEIGKKVYTIEWDKLRITHLGDISQKKIAGDVDYPISFIFIKATEGKDIYNKYYLQDYAAARKHKYPVGTYHFFSSKSSAEEQARFFLKHCKLNSGDLPPVLDLEPSPQQIQRMGGADAMWKKVRIWLDIVEQKTGMRPILYINQMFVNQYLTQVPDIKQTYPVWIARYGEYKPDIRLWIWQLAPDGKVKGIHGDVDINIFNGYHGEFLIWLNEVEKK